MVPFCFLGNSSPMPCSGFNYINPCYSGNLRVPLLMPSFPSKNMVLLLNMALLRDESLLTSSLDKAQKFPGRWVALEGICPPMIPMI